MISITQGKGFHLTFENGLTISVQIGAGNYCANYDEQIGNFPRVIHHSTTTQVLDVSSPNAEIAIWDKEGTFITAKFIGEDMVIGYLSADEIAGLIDKVRKYKQKNKAEN